MRNYKRLWIVAGLVVLKRWPRQLLTWSQCWGKQWNGRFVVIWKSRVYSEHHRIFLGLTDCCVFFERLVLANVTDRFLIVLLIFFSFLFLMCHCQYVNFGFLKGIWFITTPYFDLKQTCKIIYNRGNSS